MSIDTSDEDNFCKALRAVGLTADVLMGDCASTLNDTDDRPEGWVFRRDRLRRMSQHARAICDQLTIAEDIMKRSVPPECDLRVRAEPRADRCRVGLIEGMTATEQGWLSLAAKNGHVLEIKILDDEWTSDTAKRFTRACTTSPDEYLVAALAEKPSDT
jgi:hypothetical protein